jgi:general secretion pathway protein J
MRSGQSRAEARRGLKPALQAQAGVTLIEMLIAITLLSLLSVGMVIAIRVGLTAFSKTDSRLMASRRVAGAQRVLTEEIEGLVPVVSTCGAAGGQVAGAGRFGFFQGEEQAMRLVSTFSLQQAWRGQPQVLELFVIPGEGGRGVRLVVNEIPYTGRASVAALCMGRATDPVSGMAQARFLPVVASPHSFVLADKLAYCRFSYFTPSTRANVPPAWRPGWAAVGWPLGVRVEMAPLEADPAVVQPIAITVPIRVLRSPELEYEDN